MALECRAVVALVMTGFSMACANGQGVLAYRISSNNGDRLAIVRNGTETPVPDSSDYIPLSWSMDARWLVLGKAGKSGWWNLALVDTTSATLSPRTLDGLFSRPGWSPDGRSFVVGADHKGLLKFDLAGSEPKSSPVVPSGTNPSWSPNGGRIAFVGGESGKGLWLVPPEGTNAHNLDVKRSFESVSWSPDGRALAAVCLDPRTKIRKLTVLSSSGKEANEFATVDHPLLSWSPNGQSILCRSKHQWGVVRVADKSWKGIGLDPDSAPDWSDSQNILGVEKGRLVRISLTSGLSSEPIKTSELEKVVSFAACRGLVLDGKFPSPFAQMPAPVRGQIRIEGTVESVDIEESSLKIKVWSVTGPDLMELNLAQSVEQWVSIGASAVRIGTPSSRFLQATDFFQDGEVSMVVQGTRAGTPEVLSVSSALIPELLVTTATDANLGRGARVLEYDGVSMDTVVVPMLFPVTGKVNWSDSFLANRDGGARRHHGQDLMAPKLRPLVATFDGTVQFNRSKAGHNTISLRSDDGWTVVYMHVNNDTPGTDDGQGGPRYAFAPGMTNGTHVVRGQLVGFCGDSGNAESTSPHCHFELHDDIGGGVLNAAPSLLEAEHTDSPVYPAPAPGLLPNEGEARWDGQVVQVDSDRSVLVLELIGTLSPTGGAEACVQPRKVYVKYTMDTPVTLRSGTMDKRTVGDLKVGSFVSCFGPLPRGDDAMTARSLSIGLSLSD